MTKLYVRLETGSTEQDVVDSLVESDSLFIESSFDKLIDMLQDDGQLPDGEIFVFELVDRGTIKTDHKFISSKKTK